MCLENKIKEENEVIVPMEREGRSRVTGLSQV